MHTKKLQENTKVNDIETNRGYIDEQKLFEEKLQLQLVEDDLKNNFNLYNSVININQKENSNKIKKNYLTTKEEEDDYDNYVYNLPISNDQYFLSNIILDDVSLSKSLGFNDNLFLEKNKDFGIKSVKFNENNLFCLNNEEKNKNQDIIFLIDNMQLFTKMNKERKKNYMIDLQYNNYPYNSIDNGSTKIGQKIISRFSKNYKKNIKANQNSTIAVSHMRYASQPFNGPYLRKNRMTKNLNHTININDEINTNTKKYLIQEKIPQYNNTNVNYKNKNLNRVLDLTNLYEENKLNGNSLINFKYSNSLRKTVVLNGELSQRRPVLEEEYAFDSSGNQKFLCVKRFGDDNNNNDLISNDNLIFANKKISLNKRNYKPNNTNTNLKEIAIKNIKMNYPNKILRKSKSKNNNIKTMERFVFYSPQISYKNIFSPNNKNYLGKLYKKVSDKMKNGNNQQYTSLIKPKLNNTNIKININNNLKNSKSCLFKYWQNQPNKLVQNKNNKNNFNISNSYNIKFLNSFNKVINSENNINKNNNKSEIGINGGENNHTINNNSRNYNTHITNTESAKKNLYSFNSLNYNNMNNNNELYNSVRNRYEIFNEKNKIYFPLENIENVKVDYSNKNNYKYHEINSSKEKIIKKINSGNNKNLKINPDKQKILVSTSMDNILKKYNNLYKNISKDKYGKKIYIENINKNRRINRGIEVEKNN